MVSAIALAIQPAEHRQRIGMTANHLADLRTIIDYLDSCGRLTRVTTEAVLADAGSTMLSFNSNNNVLAGRNRRLWLPSVPFRH